MSSKLMIIAMLITLSAVGAQSQRFTKPYVVSSHSAAAASVEFNFDLTDSSLYDSTMVHRLIYRDSVATSWNDTTMSLLYQTCSTYTFSTIVNYSPPSSALEYYFRSENDTAVASQSPKNAANTFPVSSYLLADMGADPVGDAVSAAGNWLDLTGCQMSYSDTKLYFRITNAGSSYPTNSGLSFFLYTVGFVNPDATDSVAYAVVYVNVPFVMTAGLYKLNAADTSFTKIGNITTNITGNALSMSCNISDLTAQPGWPAWPPASGFILSTPLTATQTTSGLTANDQGKAGVFVPESNRFSFLPANTPPELQNYLVTWTSPNLINAQVSYRDADKNLPTIRNLHFGATDHDLTACDKSYSSWTAFDRGLTVANSGWYQYHFRFSDGKDSVSTPIDSIYVSLSVPGDADGNGMVNISDVTFLISYIFAGGPAPNPLQTGDENCDTIINVSDVVYLITYIFASGPAPVPCG